MPFYTQVALETFMHLVDAFIEKFNHFYISMFAVLYKLNYGQEFLKFKPWKCLAYSYV